ncbi:bifunctional adenosylcobinamide kinase/adenosylcobinamide-phosphate guanylyltransferase [Geobacillus subterraneus]|uniref:bifunctional adenosylcobinamide kinase/adenosylcobinamide-phosphate guanylyltransferase n=1 Tax=Geobacillus subterraneus TaxID=129338 RepID=UPI0016097038
MIVFVSGAVRSGKSEAAEACARRLADGGRLHYFATARAADAEMAARIRRHQERRTASGTHWTVWEAPARLGRFALSLHPSDVALIDCLTVWLANELFSGNSWRTEEASFAIARRLLDDVRSLADVCRAVVIVSNELFSGGVPADPGTFHYMKTLGWLHQQLVAEAAAAAVVECGLVRVKKGRWPQ